MVVGTVKWFNDSKGFGFITANGIDKDIFVHYTSIVGDGFKTLSDGQEVEFELVADSPRGPHAVNVSKAGQPVSAESKLDH